MGEAVNRWTVAFQLAVIALLAAILLELRVSNGERPLWQLVSGAVRDAKAAAFPPPESGMDKLIRETRERQDAERARAAASQPSR